MTRPNHCPEPSEVSKEDSAQLNAVLENFFGPIVANYTPRKVSRGHHPEVVKKAWEGVPLPVRKSMTGQLEAGQTISVAAPDAFNALVVAGTSEDVLQYWIDMLPSDPTCTLAFSLDEGEIDILPPQR